MKYPLLQNPFIRWATALVSFGLLIFSMFRYLVLSYPVSPIFLGSISIPAGASATRIGQLLADRGLITDVDAFINAIRVNMGTRSIQPGRYLLLNVRHMGDLSRQILNPAWRPIIVSIPEGARREHVGSYFAAKYPVDIQKFDDLTKDRAFMKSLGIEHVRDLEGYLLPETYHLRNGVEEEAIIAEMVSQTLNILNDEILQRGQAFGLNSVDILTMASIVEGEALLDLERGIISAVYHNRLKRGMRLQADPTVQYAIPDGPRRLLFRDYEYPSEYNTYLHKGLPPGPVNNPGRASILAAVDPKPVDYLYFVASGDGGHVFTHTFEEHKRAISSIREPSRNR